MHSIHSYQFWWLWPYVKLCIFSLSVFLTYLLKTLCSVTWMVEIITKCFSWCLHKYLRGTIKCLERSLPWQNPTVKVSVSKTQTANILTSMEYRWRYCADQLFCPTVHLHQSPLESKIKKTITVFLHLKMVINWYLFKKEQVTSLI